MSPTTEMTPTQHLINAMTECKAYRFVSVPLYRKSTQHLINAMTERKEPEQTREQAGLADVLEQVRAELAQERTRHPWRQPWSVRRMHEQAEIRERASAGLAA